jgi:hypothetical protein
MLSLDRAAADRCSNLAPLRGIGFPVGSVSGQIHALVHAQRHRGTECAIDDLEGDCAVNQREHMLGTGSRLLSAIKRILSSNSQYVSLEVKLSVPVFPLGRVPVKLLFMGYLGSE